MSQQTPNPELPEDEDAQHILDRLDQEADAEEAARAKAGARSAAQAPAQPGEQAPAEAGGQAAPMANGNGKARAKKPRAKGARKARTKSVDIQSGEEELPPAGPSMHPRADETFRGLWASLFYSKRTSGRCVLICSADRGEGASTVAAALALAGSTPAGVARVALVDLNLRRPALHALLGMASSPGMAEVATGACPLESVVQSVSPGLDLYAAGNVSKRALDVLRSGQLPALLATLAQAYDHVLVDVASVNQFPDAQVLAGILKDVVLVAHTERTPREAVAQAKKRLEAGGGRVVGLVLNLRTFPIPRFLYRRV